MTFREIDGIVELSSRCLLVDPSASGITVAVTIGGRAGRLALPGVPDRQPPAPGTAIGLLVPRLGRRKLPDLAIAGMVGRGWGYASGPKHVWVEAARLQISIGEEEEEEIPPTQLDRLVLEFEAWFGIAKNWVCAWTGQMRDVPGLRDHCRIHAILPTSDGDLALYGSGVFVGAVVIGERPATRPELLAAFARASAGEDVPLSYEFLMRAHDEEPRQSVIDSCTAAEVALSASLRRSWQVSNLPAETVESTLRGTSGVVELFRLFLVSGGRPGLSENRVMDQLANPRNHAAHRGATLDLKSKQRASRRLAKSSELPSPYRPRVRFTEKIGQLEIGQ